MLSQHTPLASLWRLCLLLLCFTFFNLKTALGQCETCTPDSTCISADGFPMMCPLTPPDATVNEYYSENITFYLPALVNDPSSGVEATLVEVTITSVSGLPYGLEFSFNDNDNVFLPSAGENFGCATICGTPIIPGVYQVIIAADVQLIALGFETSLQQSFSTSITVVAAEGQTGSFTFDQNAGCGSINVVYNASFSAPAPAITTHAWDFGNGTTSNLASPGIISYDAPGSYTTSLTTTIANLSLEQVSVSNLNDNWTGDIDDAFSDADPYFQLVNGSGAVVYTSGTNDNTSNTTWNFTPLVLGEPPYTVRFFDADDFTQDDDLGAASINLEQGEQFFDAGNGTVGTYTIGLSITTQLTDSTTITVFPLPSDLLTLTDNLATLEEPEPSTVFWLQNGMPAPDFTGNNAILTESGVYSVELTNEFGCSASTNEVIYCAPLSIEFNAAAGELSVPDEFASYQWYFNGLPLDAANSSYLMTTEPGNYAVQVTTDFGCDIQSSVYILESSIKQIATDHIYLFPNPASDVLGVRLPTPSDWQISNSLGVVALSGNYGASSFQVNIESLANGVYLFSTPTANVRFIKK
jgi:hypothetical protein